MAEFSSVTLGGLFSRPGLKRRPTPVKRDPRTYEREELVPPPRPHRNFIPSQELVDELVERAMAAFSKGMYWDRGSIINLVL